MNDTPLTWAEEYQVDEEGRALAASGVTALAGFALSLLRSLSQRRSSHSAGERP